MNQSYSAAPCNRPATIARAAAAYADCSTRTIHRRIKSGALPAFRMGRAIRVDLDDVERLFEPASHDGSVTSLEAHIKRVVAGFPPLAREQRDRLALLLRTGGDAA